MWTEVWSGKGKRGMFLGRDVSAKNYGHINFFFLVSERIMFEERRGSGESKVTAAVEAMKVMGVFYQSLSTPGNATEVRRAWCHEANMPMREIFVT